MGEYEVAYTRSVVDFMMAEIESERVYDKVVVYRRALALFPDIGRRYDPHYEAARPPFPCRFIAVPDTPFTLYYTKDDARRRVVVFHIEHQRADPGVRFAGGLASN